MHSIVGVFGVKEMALIYFTYTQTTKNTDSVVHINQHMSWSSNHTLHKRYISVMSKMVILYLACTLMEYFLEASALLWLW